MNERANQLAHHLAADHGVGPDVPVGVSMVKSPALYTTLLAVLKAGGAYVPVATDLPAERAAFMLRQAGAALLLTDAACPHDLPGLTRLRVDCGDGTWRFTGQPTSNPAGRSRPADLAYIIFTSVRRWQAHLSLLTVVW